MKHIQHFSLIVEDKKIDFHTCSSLEKVQISTEFNGEREQVFLSYQQAQKLAQFLLSIIPHK